MLGILDTVHSSLISHLSSCVCPSHHLPIPVPYLSDLPTYLPYHLPPTTYHLPTTYYSPHPIKLPWTLDRLVLPILHHLQFQNMTVFSLLSVSLSSTSSFLFSSFSFSSSSSSSFSSPPSLPCTFTPCFSLLLPAVSKSVPSPFEPLSSLATKAPIRIKTPSVPSTSTSPNAVKSEPLATSLSQRRARPSSKPPHHTAPS